MVTTRRSKKNDVSDITKEEDAMISQEAEKKIKSPEKGKHSIKKQAAKARKQQRKEAEKSKAMGTGLKILIDEAPKNNKIVFGEESEDDEMEQQGSKSDNDDVKVTKEDATEESNNDDDAVEEVTGQKAREEMMEQLNAEETFSMKSKKKRKKRERKQEGDDEEGDSDDDDDDNEFDDDFFAQLEAAKAEEEQKQNRKPKGKHTTFVVSQDEEDMDDSPREVDDNIQVVILKNPLQDSTANVIAAVPTNKLTQQAMMFSRGRLTNGSDGVSRGATGQKRKWQVDNTWKRSKKMNNVVRVNRVGGSRRGKRKSLAPTNFAKKG